MNTDKLKHMEEALLKNADRLDSYEHKINSMLDQSGPRLQHIAELAERETQQLLEIKNEASRLLSPIFNRVRSNPKPYIWSSVALLGVGLISLFIRRGQSSQQFSGQSFDDSMPRFH